MLALLLTPTAGYPLGLGDIHLHSGLNQPLAAEIDLLSVTAEEVSTVSVSLASNEDFAQMGLDRLSALMLIDFSVAQRPDGSWYIQVASEKPVREAFLDFLLEVNWRSGRLLREYTVLLDPPELMKQDPAPAVRAPASAPAKTPAKPAAAAVAPTSTAPASTDAASTESAKPVESPPGAAAVPAASSKRAGTYGPVKSEDTLWSIAKRMRPDRSVSVPLVMMALLKGNPEAFDGGNVNRLKAGSVLRLDPEVLRTISEKEAAREFNLQGQSFEDFRRQAAGTAARRAPTGEGAVPRGSAAAKIAEPRLKLVPPVEGSKNAPETSGKAEIPKTAEGLRKELHVAQENNAAFRQENDDLKKRVKELETQIASMQRLLSLKDDSLAALQRKAGQAPQPAAAAPAATPAQPPAAETPPTSVPAPVAAESQTPAPAVPSATATEEQTPKAAPKAAKAPVVDPAPVSKSPSLMDSLFSNPIMLGLFGVLAFAIGALIFLIIRRRRSGGGFTESILVGNTPSMLKAKNAEGKPSEETSFFSDFAVSGMGDIQAEDSEVDPLTEADVYMAYQRYQQAEDLVKEALKHNPERPELHVKLLELYHATQNRQAFEAEALKTHELLDGKGPLWDRVLVLGHELIPEHSLFAAAPQHAADVNSVDSRLDNEVLDIGLDLDALTEEMESGGHQDFDLDLGVDFSDLDVDVSKPVASSKPSEASATDDLEFDLDALIPEPPAPAPSAPAASAAPEPQQAVSIRSEVQDGVAAEKVDDLDFGSLVLEDPEAFAVSDEPRGQEELPAQASTASETVPAPAPAQEDHGLDFGLDMPDLLTEASATPTRGTAPEPEQKFDFDGLDLGSLDELNVPEETEAFTELGTLDWGSQEESPEASSLSLDGLDLGADEEDLMGAEGSEIDTKLDLARAYVGMGEAEGARNLLDEVMQEGNEPQKQQAQELLKQIA